MGACLLMVGFPVQREVLQLENYLRVGYKREEDFLEQKVVWMLGKCWRVDCKKVVHLRESQWVPRPQ